MNINELYLETIEKLKRNERPHIKLNPELIQELKTAWAKALDNETKINESLLKQILCILDNTQNRTSELNELFFQTLKTITDKDLLIYTLSASQKHIIGESLHSGVMISQKYFESLKELLKNKNPEIVEWTLRTIESMGPLSLRLKTDVRAIKPGFLKFLNQHQKSSWEIIDLMEKQWKRML